MKRALSLTHVQFPSFWPLHSQRSGGGWLAAILLGVALSWLPLQIAGALVGGGGLLVILLLILHQPLVGLGLALLLGPLGALERITFGPAWLDSGQIVLGLTLLAWLARGLLRRDVRLPHTFLNIPLFLFVIITLFTLLAAPSAVTGLREVLKWLEIALVLWLVVDCAGSFRFTTLPVSRFTFPWWIVAMLLLAGLSQALIGIWQFALRGTGPEHFLILGRFYRAYGTFEQPNPFGGFMNLTALLALGTLIGLGFGYWSNRRLGTPAIVCAVLAAASAGAATLALVFSWSRGAWLGFAAGTAVMALFLPKQRWLGAFLLALAAGLFLLSWSFDLVPAGVAGRINSFRDDFRLGDARGVDINDANYAVLERLAHWQAALDMARDDPWLGVGFGNYEPAYPQYALINWPYALGHAHNYYLNLLAETGVSGLIAYLLFWAAVFWQSTRLLRQLDWPWRGIVLGLLAAWTAFSVHHLVDNLYVNNIYVHLGVMFGLLQLLDGHLNPHPLLFRGSVT